MGLIIKKVQEFPSITDNGTNVSINAQDSIQLLSTLSGNSITINNDPRLAFNKNAIADATGGLFIDNEARTAINDLLNTLRIVQFLQP